MRDDPDGIAGGKPLDLCARSDSIAVGQCLGDGDLKLARDLGHVLTITRTRQGWPDAAATTATNIVGMARHNGAMFLDVRGVRLNVVSFGSGTRTFVATGGWTGSWELWQQPFELLTAVGWRRADYQ